MFNTTTFRLVAPEFTGYFDEIWNELDIHVGT